MRISQFCIRNFRQLKEIKINLSEKQTTFVGANNSGKTSAIQALHKFLANQGASGGSDFDTAFKTTDIPITHWQCLNQIGEDWKECHSRSEEVFFYELEWKSHLPSLDVILSVNSDEIQHVAHLIPTLNWVVGPIGIRLRLEPKNYERLYKDFVEACYLSGSRIDEAGATGESLTEELKSEAKAAIWPTDMYDFICGSSSRGTSNRLGQFREYFTIKSYFFDIENDEAGVTLEVPVYTSESESEVGANPFDGIIRIDTINAQRGFGDDEEESDRTKLSKQLTKYHDKFLNPDNLLTHDDVKELVLHRNSEASRSEQIQRRFERKFGELKKLNYPNLTAPDISVKSRIGLSQSISSVEYSTSVQAGVPSLPEYCNGLGYQNLVSITFRLMNYRDSWLQLDKTKKHIEPLHLVLIEEPEAHLHAQVQQVFIREAYKTLRRNALLKNNPNKLDELHSDFDELNDEIKFSTQLILSTHSGHIAHECDFNDLRYFKQVKNSKNSSKSVAIDLSNIFSNEDDDNRKFVARYLKSTYYDIFFADAAIFIEGSAERMLMPHFLKSFKNGVLRQRYISLLEVSGSHAFRFKDLIEKLGITTLIVTDIDSVRVPDGGKRRKSCVVALDDKCFTANSTLKKWIPCKDKVIDLIKTSDADKVKSIMHGGKLKITYQTGIEFSRNGTKKTVYPRTFEDALILSNYAIFSGITDKDNPIKLAIDDLASNCDADLSNVESTLLKIVKDTTKGGFALEVLFNFEPEVLTIPTYIHDGLIWLDSEIKRNELSMQALENGQG